MDFKIGHRARLRQKFMETKLVDYELLELLLSYAIPRIDVKPIAHALLKKFGNIGKIINADIEDLKSVPGMGESSAIFLQVVGDVNLRRELSVLKESHIFYDYTILENYAITLLCNKQVEEFHVLYVDNKMRLLSDELHAVGTIDFTAVYPREILKRMLAINAASIILLHNHPLGCESFSQEDINITTQTRDLMNAVGLCLIDHLLVANDKVISAKNIFLI